MEREHMVEIGRKGGFAAGAKPKSFRIGRARKAAAARWAKVAEQKALEYRKTVGEREVPLPD